MSILTLMFVGLKLAGFIHWSWWFVLSPELIELAFYWTLGILSRIGIAEIYQPPFKPYRIVVIKGINKVFTI